MSASITETNICNSALSKIGAPRITSIDADSPAARACKERLNLLRNEVLAAHSWKFARKRAQLATTGTPDFGWAYYYDLPNDYINMVLDPNELDVVSDFIIEGRRILANDNPIKVLYIFEETNYSNWEYQAAEALAWRLAADIGYLVSQSKELASLMMEGYFKWVKEARYNDSRQQPPRELRTDTLLAARL